MNVHAFGFCCCIPTCAQSQILSTMGRTEPSEQHCRHLPKRLVQSHVLGGKNALWHQLALQQAIAGMLSSTLTLSRSRVAMPVPLAKDTVGGHQCALLCNEGQCTMLSQVLGLNRQIVKGQQSTHALSWLGVGQAPHHGKSCRRRSCHRRTSCPAQSGMVPQELGAAPDGTVVSGGEVSGGWIDWQGASSAQSCGGQCSGGCATCTLHNSLENQKQREKHATKSIINRWKKIVRKRRPLILAGSTSEPALGCYVVCSV